MEDEYKMSNDKHEEKVSMGPVRSEFIRISDKKALQVKLWRPAPSKFNDGIMPATVEIEEITYSDDGSQPKFGPSVRIPSKAEGFMLISYIEEFLKEARKLNRSERKKLSKNELSEEEND